MIMKNMRQPHSYENSTHPSWYPTANVSIRKVHMQNGRTVLNDALIECFDPNDSWIMWAQRNMSQAVSTVLY